MRAASAALPRPLDLMAVARQRVDLAATRLGAALQGFQHRKAIALAALAPRLSVHALRASFDREARSYSRVRDRVEPAMRRLVADRRQHLSSQAKLLNSLSYRSILARGFALVSNDAGDLVRSAATISPGDALRVEFADGAVPVRVEGGEPPPRSPRPARRRQRDDDGGGQQSLF